ncbi:prepilin-type N-terminal cleavage/methylation domain-containing protein [Candidatus Falkowbacteria bacterium]|jgi:prepilin-type N-terminal cleavage/methylation domain-containing protein|nr:prepilin-type N-terminal cleavage/methylation domain-containing protein [Candidatus Falkowbacteria bacterium]MBT5502969.1 prepilin-type N-terminal cleavage/methylation domain-containing protein [Candidatus Falkowbacteria bacterium]MBT6574325.1 prepilin-type N-terminal cleavage/methylation domain-containing protein [Candidatus Falkowbacteria bacterium]MBT7349082.1 prepilin-type N-terminal cleavage/methylation domain-containing protein [Candidatus Falkowbacteria bacterium]MBT7500924.1 prepilin
MTKRKGFTLAELLIVIAIIIIIVTIVFVALDPLTKYRNERVSSRWLDINSVIHAIKEDQRDNGGAYLSAIAKMREGVIYMVVDGSTVDSCNNQNENCVTNVTDASSCVDLSGLVEEGYLGKVPISPNGFGQWGPIMSGYTLQRDATNVLHIRACELENPDAAEIYISQ